jgi:RimJ/RimL family protein N-acetyltransferase
VLLRPVEAADLLLVERWTSSRQLGEGLNDLFLPPALLRMAADSGRLINEAGGLLMVERIADSTPIGIVTWQAKGFGADPRSRYWSIGIALVPEARGRGYGTAAQRLHVDYLFETTPVNRVEACCDMENLAAQRKSEKVGLRREGVARGLRYRDGRWHDVVVYARLRGDI